MSHLGHIPNIFENLQFIIECFCAFLHSESLDWGKCCNFRKTCCTFAFRRAHADPHQEVLGGAAARAHANTILDYLESYLEKCTRALILDRLAPMTLHENFANSFLSAPHLGRGASNREGLCATKLPTPSMLYPYVTFSENLRELAMYS